MLLFLYITKEPLSQLIKIYDILTDFQLLSCFCPSLLFYPCRVFFHILYSLLKTYSFCWENTHDKFSSKVFYLLWSCTRPGSMTFGSLHDPNILRSCIQGRRRYEASRQDWNDKSLQLSSRGSCQEHTLNCVESASHRPSGATTS